MWEGGRKKPTLGAETDFGQTDFGGPYLTELVFQSFYLLQDEKMHRRTKTLRVWGPDGWGPEGRDNEGGTTEGGDPKGGAPQVGLQGWGGP